MIVVSFLPLWLGGHDLGWMIVGILVLDIGVQGIQVTNQSIIYRLAPDARSRINSAYMVCYFIGGALGSGLGSWFYSQHRWAGVCVFGAAIGIAAVLLALVDAATWPRPPPTPIRADAWLISRPAIGGRGRSWPPVDAGHRTVGRTGRHEGSRNDVERSIARAWIRSCTSTPTTPSSSAGSRSGSSGERLSADGACHMAVSASNTEMVLRIAKAFDCVFSGQELADDQISIELTRVNSDS